MLDEEQDDPAREQEEDKLGELVRRIDVPHRIHHGGDHEERERGSDRVSPVQSSPDRVDEVDDEEGDEDGRVRDVHRAEAVSGVGLLSCSERGPERVRRRSVLGRSHV
ncbi:MAG TPA: hypothetical protein VEG42_01450 [Thermoplasmata archaeon]|nr:hypothetical protein [Thermoplasmata archaeon]